MTGDEQSLLDDLLAVDSGLTGWEMDFVESLDRQCRDMTLSPARKQKMDEIAEKVGLLG